MAEIVYKTCSGCGQAKDREEFSFNRKSKDGRQCVCRVCANERFKRWRSENIDEARRASRERYHASPEKFIARVKRYAQENPHVNRAARQRWKERHPEKHKAAAFNTGARRRAKTAVGVKLAELSAWEAKQKKHCYWCGAKCLRDYEIDHYVPLSKGGEHKLSNLVISCGPCNRKKCAKDPLDFAKEVGRLL